MMMEIQVPLGCDVRLVIAASATAANSRDDFVVGIGDREHEKLDPDRTGAIGTGSPMVVREGGWREADRSDIEAESEDLGDTIPPTKPDRSPSATGLGLVRAQFAELPVPAQVPTVRASSTGDTSAYQLAPLDFNASPPSTIVAAGAAISSQVPERTQGDILANDDHRITVVESDVIRPAPRRYVNEDGGNLDESPNRISAIAISGTLVGLATISNSGGKARIDPLGTCMFRLADCSQAESRKFAQEIYEFVSGAAIDHVWICRTMTGGGDQGLANEAHIEGVLKMILDLDADPVENEKVATWVCDANPPYPENMSRGNQSFPAIRAIEVAQYAMLKLHRAAR